MASDQGLQTHSECRGEGVVVAVRGEIDLSTVEQVREALRDQDGRAPVVVLDLREVTFIDSSGLSLIVDEHQRALAQDFRFAIAAGGSDSVNRLLELTGLRGALTVVDEPDELLAVDQTVGDAELG